MSRRNHRIEGTIGNRGYSSSSSSSSSIVQNYRIKKAILIGKNGGSIANTPAPNWKMNSKSPYPITQIPDSNRKDQVPVSARKLVATLWHMNEEVVPSPRLREILEEKRNEKEIRGRDRERVFGSVQSGYLPPHLSDPSHSPVSDRLRRLGTGSHPRRTSGIPQRLMLTDHQRRRSSGCSRNANKMEIQLRGWSPAGSDVHKTRLKDLSNCLASSKDLLKVLDRFVGNEEHNSSRVSVLSALQAEIGRAHVQVNHLIQESRSDRNEMHRLIKHFAEEKAAWEWKEREKVEALLKPVKGDLEVEKKFRRRMEGLNKKLGSELAETKVALSKTKIELVNEKRAREIMEQICEELARGIDEDKAKTKELKREFAKVIEEVEKEREMLQLADVLREERVQMKLSEAKYQFEEKNAAVEKLKNELEAFLRTNKVKEKKIRSRDCGSKMDKDKEGDLRVEGQEDHGDVNTEEEEDSAESDLHSIELKFGYNNRTHDNQFSHEDTTRVWAKEENKGRKSTSGKSTRKTVPLEKKRISDGVGWDFGAENFPRLEKWLS